VTRPAPLTASLLALAALALPAAGRADWLVTTEGRRLETRGPWEVKGRLVVFTAADGTLASLRAAQVDLPASRRATAEAKEALSDAGEAPEPAPAPKRAVRSITDKDVGHPGETAGEAAGDKAAGAKTPGADAASAAAGKSPVAVATWRKVDRAEKDGLDVVGTLKNRGGDLQTDVALAVTLLDDDGVVLGTARASVTSDSIPAQQAVDFKASFPGVFLFARAKFDIQSAGLKLTLAPADKPAADGKSPRADKPN